MIHKANLTDEQLYSLVHQGNKEAFNTLFLKYYVMLCAYARQMVSLDEAENIVQDVMLWVWENKRMGEIKPSVKSYLYTAVKNKCITLINREKVKYRVKNELLDEMSHFFHDDFSTIAELKNRINEAIANLPDSYRRAFEMNRFQNKTYKEIADELDISPKTVDYRIQQALKILRFELKDYLYLLTLLGLNKFIS